MEKTAGMVKETPAWQAERMFETEMNEYMKADSEMVKLATRSLRFAIEELDKACDSVNEAAEELVDTPEGDRVASILGDMERILADLKAMLKEWGG